MIIGVKRPAIYDAEFQEQVKRYRLEESFREAAEDPSSPSWASAEEVIAAALASAASSACSMDSQCRRTRVRDIMEDSPQGPVEKRLRVRSMDSPERGAGSSTASKEAAIRGWAEALIKTLHGCPSVEEAKRRCVGVLEEVDAEVRQATLTEVEQERPQEEQPPQEGPGSLQAVQHTNKVLMRAVHHLADRCKRLEASSEETVMLRQALEQSQDAQKRLQHSNEVLQGHLRLAMSECSPALPWGSNALH